MVFMLDEAIIALVQQQEIQEPVSNKKTGYTNYGKNLDFDVKFVYPNGTTLHAHKKKLVAASPYFCAQFHGPWGMNHVDGIVNSTASVPAMEAVLHFIYSQGGTLLDSLMDAEDLIDTLDLAKQYEMPAFERLVAARLQDSISLPSLKHILFAAHLHELSDLKEACFNFIRENPLYALTERSIVSIAQENPTLWDQLVAAVRPGENDSKAETTDTTNAPAPKKRRVN